MSQQLGKIGYDGLTQDEIEFLKQGIEEAEKEQRINPLPYILTVITLAIAVVAYFTHGTIAVIAAIVICLICLGFYPRQINKARKLVKTGGKLAAKKSAIAGFIPLLVSANTTIYSIFNSNMFQSFAHNAFAAVNLFKAQLEQLAPTYSDVIFYGLFGIIIIGVNSVVIKNFRRVLQIILK